MEKKVAGHVLSEFDVMHAIYARRAVRAFRAEPVPADVIGDLLGAAVQAPTAMHQEPWGFVVVQDKDRLARYSERAKSLLLEPQSAFVVGWGSARKRKPSSPDHLAMLADPRFNIFYDASTLIVVCRRLEAPLAEADCWLAAQNLMLAATAKGLGSCCIGFALPVLNLSAVKRELGIPDDGAAVAPIVVGYPRGEAAAVTRKPPQVLRWVK